jgi:hypothetical protein
MVAGMERQRSAFRFERQHCFLPGFAPMMIFARRV